ncbi:MAG: hypothetical protein K8F53_12630 [Rhodocyclaceae bacterium]|nr:hypothetical protein [Rhodocyclaceae bacterium]
MKVSFRDTARELSVRRGTDLKLSWVNLSKGLDAGLNRHSLEGGNPEAAQNPPSQPAGESQSQGYGNKLPLFGRSGKSIDQAETTTTDPKQTFNDRAQGAATASVVQQLRPPAVSS